MRKVALVFVLMVLVFQPVCVNAEPLTYEQIGLTKGRFQVIMNDEGPTRHAAILLLDTVTGNTWMLVTQNDGSKDWMEMTVSGLPHPNSNKDRVEKFLKKGGKDILSMDSEKKK